MRRVQLSREEAISLALSSSQFGFHFATEKDEIFRAEEDFVKNKYLGSSLLYLNLNHTGRVLEPKFSVPADHPACFRYYFPDTSFSYSLYAKTYTDCVCEQYIYICMCINRHIFPLEALCKQNQ